MDEQMMISIPETMRFMRSGKTVIIITDVSPEQVKQIINILAPPKNGIAQ